MKSEFSLAFNQICNERGISKETVLETLQMALVSAYRRDAEVGPNQNVTAQVDLETGRARIFVEKQVVQHVTNPVSQISLSEARAIQPNVQLGDTIMVDCTPKDFGRIAAQSAKQIILQRIREAEREARYTHYMQQEGEIVHGTVQSIKPHGITLHLEGTEAFLPREQQVPGEHYTLHQRLRAYVLEVHKTGRGPQIIVSRSHSNMLRRLLELEVPEILNGTVEIKAIAREAGSRSKVAVVARQPGVDPVGSCVGMRGVRIQSIVNELGGEKIDVIEWSPNPAVFIAKALSPAKVLTIQLEDLPGEGQTASVVVPDDQLSLAIGRSGQNARLAAKLTGWRIDIQSVTDAAKQSLRQAKADHNLTSAVKAVADAIPVVEGILRQHEQDKMPYTAEEMLTLRQFIEGVRGYYAQLRKAERSRMVVEEKARLAALRAAEAQRRASIEAARARIPARAYVIPLETIGLSQRVLDHLKRNGLDSVGDVMERLAEGDEGLLRLDGVGPKNLAEIKQAIANLQLTEEPPQPVEEVAAPPAEVEAAELVPAAEERAAAQVEDTTAAPELPAVEAAQPVLEGVIIAEAEQPPAQELLVPEEKEEKRGARKAERFYFEEEEEEEFFGGKPHGERKKDRRSRKQFIYDEELGKVVAHRRRKREGGLDEWDEYLR
ncbi:MAG: transcription termination factor NusA [Anaerolineae bacterium]|nr:transcription termination factor NusA [Anaerolineae bacterium]